MLHLTNTRAFRFLSFVLCSCMLMLSSCATTTVTKHDIDRASLTGSVHDSRDVIHIYLQNGQHWLFRDYFFNDTLQQVTGLCNPHGDDVQFAMTFEGRVTVPYSEIRQIQRHDTRSKIEPIGTTISVALAVGFIATIALFPKSWGGLGLRLK